MMAGNLYTEFYAQKETHTRTHTPRLTSPEATFIHARLHEFRQNKEAVTNAAHANILRRKTANLPPHPNTGVDAATVSLTQDANSRRESHSPSPGVREV